MQLQKKKQNKTLQIPRWMKAMAVQTKDMAAVAQIWLETSSWAWNGDWRPLIQAAIASLQTWMGRAARA